jgi:DNA-binding NarL/FixJ family response regulator
VAFVIPTFAQVVVVAQEPEAWEHATLQLGAVDFATASIGPEEVTEACRAPSSGMSSASRTTPRGCSRPGST